VDVHKSLCRQVSPIQTSEQIIENVKMSMENVVESQVVQNAEQGPAPSQDTVNDPSGELDLLIDR
jgi:hypothetical protein